ncbi:Pentatricopeptide repeat-containing protein [Vitis vinifera]|uniref:Pentatricopeptide repeat-containing protein n=1 Tax=Vitis vinifera TaxID=29760 RepID=A0A438BZS6_VITVI|nr:Pentatricopeptide repeat-containing protein [Vitis vinifera]
MASQGQVTEAESMFTKMKMAGCHPDVITYTAMIHAYDVAENWEKASALFLEMETDDVQPDSIACSSLMRAFNKGGQPAKLREWREIIGLIKLMEPSISVVSIGLLNQLLHFLGKSGKIETMMKLFYKIVASGAEINFYTYSILLKNLLAAGNWRKYIEVLQWMEEAGLQPSVGMYRSISSFAQNRCGAEYAAVIQERIGIKIQQKMLNDSLLPASSLLDGTKLFSSDLPELKSVNRGILRNQPKTA